MCGSFLNEFDLGLLFAKCVQIGHQKENISKCKTVADKSRHLSPAQFLTNQKGE